MPLHVTPQRVAAVYDCLREFPPFCRWNLPVSDEVEFHVGTQKDAFAIYHRLGDQHALTISMRLVRDWPTLVETTAHEMIHLYQARAGTETRVEHNREWHRLAAQVCDAFGWRKETF